MNTETKTGKIVLPTSWEHYCELTGRDPKQLPDVSIYDEDAKAHAIADFKLGLVIKHCNGGTVIDNSTIMYEPWFRKVADASRPSGFGLSYNVYDYWTSSTRVGPRLSFVNHGDMIHVKEHFAEEYADLLV